MIVLFRRKSILTFLLIGVASLFLSGESWAVDPADEPVKSEILQGIELTINNQFDQAIQIYQKLKERYPHHRSKSAFGKAAMSP